MEERKECVNWLEMFKLPIAKKIQDTHSINLEVDHLVIYAIPAMPIWTWTIYSDEGVESVLGTYSPTLSFWYPQWFFQVPVFCSVTPSAVTELWRSLPQDEVSTLSIKVVLEKIVGQVEISQLSPIPALTPIFLGLLILFSCTYPKVVVIGGSKVTFNCHDTSQWH